MELSEEEYGRLTEDEKDYIANEIFCNNKPQSRMRKSTNWTVV